jgi:uncharacterized protein
MASRSEVEELSREECEQLLASQSLGRIAIVVDGRPQIFPVNYVFEDEVVVFRTSWGLKVDRSPLTPVAFETDMVDTVAGEAWSVVVHGTAQDITAAIDSLSVRLRHLAVAPAAPGERPYWMGVPVLEISGRRFRIPR